MNNENFENKFTDVCESAETTPLVDVTQDLIAGLCAAAKQAGYDAVRVQIGGWFTYMRADLAPHIYGAYETSGIASDAIKTGDSTIDFGVDADHAAVVAEMKSWRDTCADQLADAKKIDALQD